MKSHIEDGESAMQTFLAVVAAIINLVAIALFHNSQFRLLNGIAAGLCLIVAVLALRKRS